MAVPLAVLLLLACAAGFVAVREPRMRGFRRFRDHKVKQGGGNSDGGGSDDGKPKVRCGLRRALCSLVHSSQPTIATYRERQVHRGFNNTSGTAAQRRDLLMSPS